MKIAVEYNGSHYYWVDTVVMHDEYDYTCAILVSSDGKALPTDIDKITIVDDAYNLEKVTKNEIERLKSEQAQLQLEMELDAAIARIAKPVTVVEQ